MYSLDLVDEELEEEKSRAIRYWNLRQRYCDKLVSFDVLTPLSNYVQSVSLSAAMPVTPTSKDMNEPRTQISGSSTPPPLRGGWYQEGRTSTVYGISLAYRAERRFRHGKRSQPRQEIFCEGLLGLKCIDTNRTPLV